MRKSAFDRYCQGGGIFSDPRSVLISSIGQRCLDQRDELQVELIYETVCSPLWKTLFSADRGFDPGAMNIFPGILAKISCRQRQDGNPGTEK